MRYLPLRDITQRWLVVGCRSSGQRIMTVNKGPIGCPESSVNKNMSALPTASEERKPCFTIFLVNWICQILCTNRLPKFAVEEKVDGVQNEWKDVSSYLMSLKEKRRRTWSITWHSLGNLLWKGLYSCCQVDYGLNECMKFLFCHLYPGRSSFRLWAGRDWDLISLAQSGGA
jgi:hypothetical protein